MEALGALGPLLGGAWASGVNLYLTIVALGAAQRLGWIALPAGLEGIASYPVIGVAAFLFLIEFVADKIPYVDSAWDAVHTFIRPVGGAVLGFMAVAGTDTGLQIAVALLTGAIAMNSHLTKSTARAALNTSPEPVSNSIASVVEDVSVIGVLILAITHPIITAILVLAFVVFSIWFLRKMFRFLKRVLSFRARPREASG